MARPLRVPPRHGGRKAHLHRSFPQRQSEVPGATSKTPERVDIVAVTHGHGDHVGDTVALAKKHGCTVVAAGRARLLARERRASRTCSTRTRAAPSRSTASLHADERAPLELEPRRRVHGRAVRHRGARSRTGRSSTSPATRASSETWQLIGRLYSPTSPSCRSATTTRWVREEAAVALELLGTKRCVPCHYGTFPPLVGTPARTLQELAPDVPVEDDRAGRLGHRMRERWWGGSGRRVPELAVEGDPAVPADEALVLDGVDDLRRRSPQAFARRHAGRRARGVAGGGARGARAARGGVPSSCRRTRATCSSST